MMIVKQLSNKYLQMRVSYKTMNTGWQLKLLLFHKVPLHQPSPLDVTGTGNSDCQIESNQ